MEIKGKICVVTGAARGIGATIAKDLAEKGAIVYAVDVEATGQSDERIHNVACDVSNEKAVEGLFARLRDEQGGVDVLVNNAGIIRDGLLVKRREEKLEKLSLAAFRQVVEVNLVGTFLCGREAALAMVERGGGVIVNISSVSRAGNYGQTNYSASKAAIDAMTVTWSKELARHGIRVAAVAPGYTRTEMVAVMRAEVLEKITAQVPLKRLGEMHEIASAVDFIIANDFYTGRILELDGGLRL